MLKLHRCWSKKDKERHKSERRERERERVNERKKNEKKDTPIIFLKKEFIGFYPTSAKEICISPLLRAKTINQPTEATGHLKWGVFVLLIVKRTLQT